MDLHNEIKESESDILREVGNIGAGHAATALSILLNKPINMNIPTANMLEFADITKRVGDDEQPVVAVYFHIEGDITGHIFFIVDTDNANNILKNLVGLSDHTYGKYSELELSALAEIGNILAGSYLNALCELTNLNIMHSVPSLVIDMTAAVLDHVYVQFSEIGDHAMLIDTQFIDGTHDVNSHFFLIPDLDSFSKIFKSLGADA